MSTILIECMLALFWTGFIGLHVWLWNTREEEAVPQHHRETSCTPQLTKSIQ